MANKKNKKSKESSKVKKILFLAPRDPFSGRYSGDVLRAKKFVEFFKKKNHVTVISSGYNSYIKNSGKLKIINFRNQSLILKLIYSILSFLNLRPLQLGFFYSSKINKFVKENFKKFDIIFCQSIRVAPYVSDLEIDKKILDMGDIYSKNYYQTFKAHNFFNPIKLIYFLESILMKRYEKLCLEKFDKILLFSKKEILYFKSFRHKIKQIKFGVDIVKKKFGFNKKNNKILFIGNIKYLPNKMACKNFINKILPKIHKINQDIQFHIIGEISKLDKFFWKQNSSVVIHGKVKKIDTLISKSICGLANLNISSGIQTKILTYMSYGIPSVSSHQVSENFDAIKSSKLPTYKNEKELIKLIFKLKNNKKFSEFVSSQGLKTIKTFLWKKILTDLNKI